MYTSADLHKLQSLWLDGNPLAYAPFYRLDVLSWVPTMSLSLDGVATQKEELEAAGLRVAGQIPLAWQIMSEFVGQRELLWRPPKRVNMGLLLLATLYWTACSKKNSIAVSWLARGHAVISEWPRVADWTAHSSKNFDVIYLPLDVPIDAHILIASHCWMQYCGIYDCMTRYESRSQYTVRPLLSCQYSSWTSPWCSINKLWFVLACTCLTLWVVSSDRGIETRLYAQLAYSSDVE